MRMILISLLMWIAGSTAAYAVDFDYDFKPGTQCENANHTDNLTGMASIRDKLTQVILSTKETDLFQHAWLESVNSDNPKKYDGFADAIFIYKNYPNAGMVIAFKDGCYVGHINFTLDDLNNIIYRYELKSKGM